MIDQIRAYIERAFEQAPQTQKVLELKEELISNLTEKYREQLAQGKTESEAYHLVIGGIGDLTELIDSVRPQPFSQPTEKERRKNALLIAVAVGLYILSPFTVVLFSAFGQEIPGVLVMFLFIALATGMLIYNHLSRPKYIRQDETVVEEFKEWSTNRHKKHGAYHAFRGAYWALVVAAYLLVSFLCGYWAFSWILFIIAAAIDRIVKGILELREERL